METLLCDGCGQAASPEHLAQRLRRLEFATRYRPIHLQAVFLGAHSPQREEDYLYAVSQDFQGEAATLLDTVKVDHAGRDAETVLGEFQRKGFFLAYVLECPLDPLASAGEQTAALRRKLPGTLKRLRTSLRAKRLVVCSAALKPFLVDLKIGNTTGELVLDGDVPFEFEGIAAATSSLRLRLGL